MFVRSATRVASRVAGEKDLRTVRGTRRRTARHNAGKAGASGPIHESVVIFFAPVAALALNKATASLARTFSTMEFVHRSVHQCKSKIFVLHFYENDLNIIIELFGKFLPIIFLIFDETQD